jgi:hypothetical protein
MMTTRESVVDEQMVAREEHSDPPGREYTAGEERCKLVLAQRDNRIWTGDGMAVKGRLVK